MSFTREKHTTTLKPKNSESCFCILLLLRDVERIWRCVQRHRLSIFQDRQDIVLTRAGHFVGSLVPPTRSAEHFFPLAVHFGGLAGHPVTLTLHFIDLTELLVTPPL